MEDDIKEFTAYSDYQAELWDRYYPRHLQQTEGVTGRDKYRADAAFDKRIESLAQDGRDGTGLDYILETTSEYLKPERESRPKPKPWKPSKTVHSPAPAPLAFTVEEVDTLYPRIDHPQVDLDAESGDRQESALVVPTGNTYLDRLTPPAPKRGRGRPKKIREKISWEHPCFQAVRRMSSTGPVTEIIWVEPIAAP